MTLNLTPNNQRCAHGALAATATCGCFSADDLTNNTDQPNRRFSDDTPPPHSHTPKTTTTGCTTLPPDPMATTGKVDPNQQSGIDPRKFREDFAFIDDPYYGLNPPPPHRSESRVTPADLDPLRILRAQATEKDPPVTEPTAFQDFVAGLPGDPTGTTLNSTDDYAGPHLYIIFDQDAQYVRIEDEEERVFFTDAWEKSKAQPDANIFTLTIPDWRHLRDEDIAQAAQNQVLAAENERLQFQLANREQTITDLRGANTQILRRMTELQDKNRQIAKERSALTAALQIANETMRISIEKIASLLRVIK